MKTLLGLLTLLFSLQSFAEPINCLKPKDLRLDGDFCSISYRTLAAIQEMQINGKVSADLDLQKMENILTSGEIKTEDLKADLWKKASLQAKANRSFKLLLKHSKQMDTYLQFTLDQTPTTTLALGDSSSTGTRGGGFGKEAYILPQGFWIP